MYRVELKDLRGGVSYQAFEEVPNVPCGVERREWNLKTKKKHEVPNVPCGVESFGA